MEQYTRSHVQGFSEIGLPFLLGYAALHQCRPISSVLAASYHYMFYVGSNFNEDQYTEQIKLHMEQFGQLFRMNTTKEVSVRFISGHTLLKSSLFNDENYKLYWIEKNLQWDDFMNTSSHINPTRGYCVCKPKINCLGCNASLAKAYKFKKTGSQVDVVVQFSEVQMFWMKRIQQAKNLLNESVKNAFLRFLHAWDV